MEKFFKIKERGSTLKTEIFAGITTFFAMAYIIFVNPNQVAAEGANGWLVGLGADPGTMGQIWNSVYIASIIVAIIGTLLMAFVADMPFAQACGMGLNSFFCTIFVAGSFFAGEDVKTGYQAGLVIVFLSGIVFLLLSVTGLRKYIAVSMPECLKKAIPAGIGLFIAMIGFKNAGIIEDNQYTFVQFYDFHGRIKQIGTEVDGVMVTGLDVWHQIVPVVVALLGVLIVAFCLVDMFDTIGTIYGTAASANMMDENGDPISMNECMLCDSIGTVSGALLGTSTCTTFVESASGVGAGGRTGFTSIITALCFVFCLFLSPLASVIPSCATAPALIYVGVLMARNFAKVDMDDMLSAVPAFLALIMMPLTYSISNGIGIGAIAYVVIALFTGNYKKKDIVITVIAALFVCKFIFVTM